VKLPDGFVVESGLEFRNTFHLMGSRVSADFFVPCGGRPAAVNSENWQVRNQRWLDVAILFSAPFSRS
jgi:glutamate dehydrogenase